MKVMWICNTSIPKVAQILGKENSNHLGGWLVGLSEALLKDDDIELYYCFPDYEGCFMNKGNAGKFTFFAIPMTYTESQMRRKNGSQGEKIFQKILNTIRPDVIHFFGTEFIYTSTFIEICHEQGFGNRVVTSIQGLVGIYSLHYEAGVPKQVCRQRTLAEFRYRTGILDMKKKFKNRGLYEQNALKKSQYIIGRTSWDKACATLIANKSFYISCNETLREEFYEGNWNYESCNPYQIFVSQGSVPYKGLHMVVEAVKIVKQFYPDVKVVVAGNHIFSTDWLRGNSYGMYISRKIAQYDLGSHFRFTGNIDGKTMKRNLLDSNVFVCPSAIENSPNSLGEAMMLGVPCVAADVGGVQDMMTRNVEGYTYPFNEPYKLAYYIMEIFKNPDKAQEIAKSGRERALKTHNPEINNKTLKNIYERLIHGAD